jgi:mxaL protein
VVGNEHLSQLREGYLRLLADELSFSYMRLESPAAGARGLSRRMQQRPLARVAPTPVSMRPLFGLIGLLALLWVYRAVVLHRLSARVWQRLRTAWFGRAQPSGAGAPR